MFNFLRDYVRMLQDKYDDTLLAEEDGIQGMRGFHSGANFAYYDCLDTLELQLTAFGHDKDMFGQISPMLGKLVRVNAPKP